MHLFSDLSALQDAQKELIVAMGAMEKAIKHLEKLPDSHHKTNAIQRIAAAHRALEKTRVEDMGKILRR